MYTFTHTYSHVTATLQALLEAPGQKELLNTATASAIQAGTNTWLDFMGKMWFPMWTLIAAIKVTTIVTIVTIVFL